MSLKGSIMIQGGIVFFETILPFGYIDFIIRM